MQPPPLSSILLGFIITFLFTIIKVKSFHYTDPYTFYILQYGQDIISKSRLILPFIQVLPGHIFDLVSSLPLFHQRRPTRPTRPTTDFF